MLGDAGLPSKSDLNHSIEDPDDLNTNISLQDDIDYAAFLQVIEAMVALHPLAHKIHKRQGGYTDQGGRYFSP